MCPSSKKHSVVPNLVLFFTFCVVALILRFYGHPLLINVMVTSISVCTSNACYGIGAVYRISMALFLYFVSHYLLVGIGKFTEVDRVHHFFIKCVAFAIFLVIAWLLPDAYYEAYVWVSRFVSVGFLVLQLIFLVDLAYRIKEKLLDREQFKLFLGASAVLYIVSIVSIGLMFAYYSRLFL